MRAIRRARTAPSFSWLGTPYTRLQAVVEENNVPEPIVPLAEVQVPRGSLGSADGEIFLAALRAHLVGREKCERIEFLGQRAAERCDRFVRIAVGTADRLRHHPLDDAELLQMLGGDPHRLG